MGWQDGYLVEKVKENDRVGTLELLAVKLARKIDTTSDARTIASLTKQFREILEELDGLKPNNQSQQQDGENKLYVMQSKAAARLAGTMHQAGAKAS